MPAQAVLTCAGTPELADEGRCMAAPPDALAAVLRALKLHELPLNDICHPPGALRGQRLRRPKRQPPPET